MKKIDAFLAGLIGFLNGVFLWLILGQMGMKIPFFWILPFVFALLGALGIYIASIIGKRILIIFQAAKFFLVGTLNTFIDIGVLNLLIWFTEIGKGPIYSLFKTISFLVATTNSYFWNKFWTFEKKRGKTTPREFLKFLIFAAIGLGINVGVASLVVNIIGPQFGLNERIWSGAVGPVIAAFFAFVWNFLASKFIVFK